MKPGTCRIAVTGHQDLGDAIGWIRQHMGRVVADLQPAEGLTSLARGADQLFAQVLAVAGIPWVAVIPCDRYEDAFPDDAARAEYRRLLALASRTTVLPFPSPGEEAYWAAGQHVVDGCDLVLAIWNGQPARGRGGTGEVVAYARSRGKPLIVIDPVGRSVTGPFERNRRPGQDD